MRYFFILGKNRELSMAELMAVLQLDSSAVRQLDGYALVESGNVLDLKKIQERLGGTVKCGEIVGEVTSVREIPDLVLSKVDRQAASGKFHFGFSNYSPDHSITRSLHAAGITIKRRLKEAGISSRLVASKEPELSSVIVAKEKLIAGWDVCLFGASIVDGRSSILIGKTSAVQDFKSYGERDYGRPGADSLSGMLPPKLAKIMINLAEVPDGGSILDPFCGSGTVLQEALLLGFKKITGNDMETKAVADTKRNVAWLAEKYGVDVSEVRVLQGEAETISNRVTEVTSNRGFDAIITEPYLGPALRGRESVQELLKTKRGLEQLYLAAFEQYLKVLKSGGRVVMVLPIFVSKGELMSMDIIDDVKKMGFGVVNPLAHSSPSALFPPRSAEAATRRQGRRGGFRWPLMYYREGQKVYREIWVFEKK